jgi:endonuclease YncB( thermonuclease family)
MSFTLIKGAFFWGTGTPDGDSVRFKADVDQLFDRLAGKATEFKSNGTVQLRYEGIDALEKQAIEPFASDATAANIAFLAGNSAGQNSARGYILSRQNDGNRRPVCFVFTGDTQEADGASVFLTGTQVEKSVNYQMLEAGYAYPMFYETLFMELREPLTEAFLGARRAQLGIHAMDASLAGVTLNSRADLKTIPPIYPKLWRRLEEYLRNHPNASGFAEFLKNRRKEKLHTLSDSRFNISFDNVVENEGNQVRLLYEPYDMVFKPV